MRNIGYMYGYLNHPMPIDFRNLKRLMNHRLPPVNARDNAQFLS